ncbi:dipeptide ABC transporter ATP-binding protein [Microbacterium trichothecenolyticum]|uniref:Peptide/nickel transport system ATP-binding protein n=1 Tax=Microbacterium trichothecenolyticum TaxID=69370 RepID=A0ABU0TUV1_MICTR|nr:ABC transporter ATP-binding protein [Microbacterium trichothecenolyticum]MDQ1123444.1 peptide/nickel transport system ATP-binding protein [Microbacterium trichothecenolyticum]
MSAPLVRVRDLRVSFGDTVAVDGVGFDLEPGRCVALVGESGSGKSVTGRSLLGLVGPGSRVEAEELTLDGTDLLGLGEHAWRRVRGADVGLVLQDALVSLDPFVRIGPQVTDAVRVHTHAARGDRRERALELLADVGVPEPELRAAQYPHELSGGLRQRALIASALAAGPRVLIADEPTTALDVTVQRQVLHLLRRVRDEGTALLLVSHDLAVVADLADEILVLKDGQVVERGEASRVLSAPSAAYTRRLIDAIPSERSRGERLSQAAPVRLERPAPTPRRSVAPRRLGVIRSRAETPVPPASPTRDPLTPALRVTGVTKTYRRPDGGRLLAVDDISFTLPRGTSLGVVGESGSGKSTLAGIVLGLTAADTGTVELDGEPWVPATERARRARRHRIQVISQDPLGSFDPRHDVEAVVSEALGAAGVARRDRRERAGALLQQVGLDTALLSRHPLSLSGGQRQRVAIVRALAVDPEVLVCDEPVSALDVSVQAQVLDLLSDLRVGLGISLLFISHDLGVVRHVADDVVVMRAGRIVESGAVDDVFDDPRHPYTRELVRAIPTLPTRS